jgi:hypothetical protein
MDPQEDGGEKGNFYPTIPQLSLSQSLRDQAQFSQELRNFPSSSVLHRELPTFASISEVNGTRTELVLGLGGSECVNQLLEEQTILQICRLLCRFVDDLV